MQAYYYISNLTTVSLSIGLAFFILAQSRKPINLLFFFYSLCVAGWAAAKFLSWTAAGPWPLFWMRSSIAVAVFIPVIYYHFSVRFTEKENSGLVPVYFCAFVLFVLSPSNFMVARLGQVEGIKTIIPGPLYIVFWIFFGALIISGFLNFYRGLKTPDVTRKNQLKYLILASVIGFGGGMLVFASNLLPQLEPIGYGFIPLYSLIAAYAIVKHRLLDISVVIRSGIVYSILTLFITGTYFLGLIAFRDYFAGLTATNPFLLNFSIIILFVLLFQPLRARIQEAVDRTFYKEKIDRERAIISFSGRAMNILDLNELLDFILKSLREVLKIRQAEIYIKDHEFVERMKNSPGTIFLSDREILLPIFLKDELLGVLHVKDKLSCDSFSLFDVELLKTFLNQAASALKNSFLLDEIIEHKRQLYQASNLAALGTLAAGMSHEIKNPLAVIKGLTQVLPENLEDKEFLSKFVEIVPGQIDRINQTVEALLKIGKGPALKKKRLSLNILLEDIIGFVRLSFKNKDIEVKTRFSGNEQVFGDYNMLYQAFFNLIQNAAQAMPEGGIITLRILAGGSVEIEDTGSGIPEDKIGRIFSPFVTSKEGGVGMGLFMVKKILSDHDARITVRSIVGSGTVFCVDFLKTGVYT